MKLVLYAPIRCAVCHRQSFRALSARDIQHRLDADISIDMRCGFDHHVWSATFNERTVLRRLLAENEKVDSARSIRLPDIGYRTDVAFS